MLWQGALVLALADLVLLLLLTGRVDTAACRQLALVLPAATALPWALLCVAVLASFAVLRVASSRGASAPAPSIDKRMS
jgi:hypothetical protein